MDTEILEQIGLEKDEIKIYLILLRIGSITATKIASETNIYRTNVYRLLDSLISKGLASYILKNNVKYFSASSPKKLLDDQKKKQQELQKLILELEKIPPVKEIEFKVETFKGKEGLVAVLKYVLRERKDYVVFGEEGKFQEILPYFIEQLLRDIKNLSIHERILSKESMKGRIKLTKNSKIRYLPEKYFSPTMTVVFGDFTAIFDWNEPYHAVLINSKPMAESYKNYFELLWKIAKK
jgi:HTH-type transcriptional regulator, sugar sensing transcriptional regulator